MSRRPLCLLLLLIPSLAFCQNPESAANLNKAPANATLPSSPVEVVYVVHDSIVTTYNIDPQTFEPAVAGTTTMPKSKYPHTVSSPSGQFLYYFANSSFSTASQKLYVFDTDANGVPGGTPVQATNAGQLLSFVVNPSSTFSYSVALGPIGQQFTRQYAIVRNAISANNGALSQPVTEATYTLDSDASGNDCGLVILGFNPSGTTMYDEILCSSPHASGSETFYERSVDLQTGALGSDEQVYGFSYYAGSGYADVQFENNLLFAFVSFFNQGPNANLVQIYQTQPYDSTPLVNCAASMLAICGDYSTAVQAHPSGNYVFLGATNNQTDILQVDLTTQQLVQVGTVGGNVEKFSPDGSVIYGDNPSPRQIRIAGFNAANGQVTLGGSIQLPSIFDFWNVAERY